MKPPSLRDVVERVRGTMPEYADELEKYLDARDAAWAEYLRLRRVAREAPTEEAVTEVALLGNKWGFAPPYLSEQT